MRCRQARVSSRLLISAARSMRAAWASESSVKSMGRAGLIEDRRHAEHASRAVGGLAQDLLRRERGTRLVGASHREWRKHRGGRMNRGGIDSLQASRILENGFQLLSI